MNINPAILNIFKLKLNRKLNRKLTRKLRKYYKIRRLARIYLVQLYYQESTAILYQRYLEQERKKRQERKEHTERIKRLKNMTKL